MKKTFLALCAALTATFIQFVVAAEADPRISVALKRNDIKFDIDEDGDYQIIFETDEDSGRSQLIFVNSSVEKYGSLEIREIWSFGYRVPDGSTVPASVIKKAVISSNDYIIGSWELLKSERSLIYCAKMPANLDDDTLIKTIISVGNRADEFEKETLGTDDL
ncbi:MAG: hypothetical protein II943_08120 [Victivallales bacterium]|nr:hypothetical protein [Victivallales bacterium]